MEIERISFPIHTQKETGSTLLVAEAQKEIPFEIKRIYCISNCKKDEVRCKHAHKRTQRVLVCLKGNCQLLFNDGKSKKHIDLKSGDQGVILETYIWHELRYFSSDCTLLIFADALFDETDYIRDYDEFVQVKSQEKS